MAWPFTTPARPSTKARLFFELSVLLPYEKAALAAFFLAAFRLVGVG